MSGLVDCMVRVADDVGKSAAYGVESMALATKESFKNVVFMAGDISNGIVTGIGDTIKAFDNLFKEEKSLYNKALSKYQESIALDETKKEEYYNQVLSSSSFDEFNINKQKVIKGLTSSNGVKTINEMFNFTTYYHKCNDAIIELSNDERVISYKGKLNALKQEFMDVCDSASLTKIESINSSVNELTQELTSLVKEKMEQENAYNVTKLNEIFINLSSDIGESYIYLLNNELTQLLNKEEEDSSLNEENKLLDLKKSIIDYAFKLDKLENIEGIKECQDLIKYVYDTLTDNTLTNSVKIQRVELRVNALKDDYLKCEKENQEVFELKSKFDAEVWRNTSFKKYLNINTSSMSFNASSARSDIKNLEKENKDLLNKCNKKRKNEHLRKVLKEAMIENELEYVTSKELSVNSTSINQDIYHIDNGNVVVVSINDKGSLNYYVSKVNIDGISNDDSKTVESMHKFCNKYKNIEKTLKENGIQVDEKRRLEPNLKYVKEIEVNSSSKEIIKNKIKKSKFVKSELKSKHVGD